MNRQVTVPLLVHADRLGSERIIPQLSDLKKQLHRARTMLDDIEYDIETSPIDAEKEALKPRVQPFRSMIRKLEQAIEKHGEVASKCIERRYVLNMPTYDQLLAMESAARRGGVDDPQIDPAALFESVRSSQSPPMFNGETPSDRAEWFACWDKWREEAYGDNTDLTFYCSGN